MKSEIPRCLRCAIYTRKSSEEGLDQAFNSLHAQREACEAYVKSQAHEGWSLIPTLYDDGGFSGGNLERPALRKLLGNVDAGKIDVVVVYKVDRLTRALADFAKIVERLDAVGASFVSVTQAFNTTSSMGRLTLNVLLSFAQFEREVTGERIRDKIAASKAKGMWMGGNLPLGYDAPTDPTTRALVVNGTEAAQVRTIFERYLELGSVHALAVWLDGNAIRSKLQISNGGRPRGGVPFSRGALFHLLRNRTYLGEIPHKGKTYTGAHPAIVEASVFEAAQSLLGENRRRYAQVHRRMASMPFKGLIFDTDGQPMSPTVAHGKSGRQYRYYVSAPLQQGKQRLHDDAAIRRVAAETIETVVQEALTRIARRASFYSPKLSRVEVHEEALHLVIERSSLFAPHGEPERELERLRAKLGEGERVLLEANGEAVRVVLPVRVKTWGGRTWLLAPDGRPAVQSAAMDRSLVNALRAAHNLADEYGLKARRDRGAPLGPIPSTSTYQRRSCQLAFLAPDIQEAILAGRQQRALTLAVLLQENIPADWDEQLVKFGFESLKAAG